MPVEQMGYSSSTAILYDAHHRMHLEDIPFWHALAGRQGNPVLELGCGTGRVLLELAHLDWDVTGMDNNHTMLSVLQKHAAGETNRQLSIILGDMLSFRLARRFALIIIPCNTFSTLSSSQRSTTISRIREHILPTGLLALSVPNPEILHSLPKRARIEFEESFIHPLTGDPVEVSSAWQRTSDQVIFTWYYDHLLADGRVERSKIQTAHWLPSLNEYRIELENGGFLIEQIHGDYDFTSYNAASPFLLILAKPYTP